MVSANIIEYVNALFLRMNKKCEASSTIVIGGMSETKPTQQNKPSPSSHFEVQTLLKRKNAEYPRSGGYLVTIVANTNSMEPLIDDNSIVVCEDFRTVPGKRFLANCPIRVGDICIYQGDPAIWGTASNGMPKLIIHTVIDIRETIAADGAKKKEVQFKGYNNFFPDPVWVPEDKIILRAFEYACAQQPRLGD